MSMPRFLLINPFHLPAGSRFLHRPVEGPREVQVVNFKDIEHTLRGIDWDFDPGPVTTHGDWSAASREEFAYVAADRLKIVRAACASGRYDAIVLLGGAEPGFQEAREIGRSFGMPVTGCAFSQMHIA
jgi:allantoin racemase